MKFWKSLLVLTAILLTVQSGEGFAQQDPKTFTLDECIATGLERNYELKRSRFGMERSETGKMEAIGQFIPTLGASGTYTRNDRDIVVPNNDNFFISRNSYSISASSNLTLFDGMANFASVDQSLLNLEASEMDYNRQRETFIYSVTDAYYNGLRILNLVKVNEANLKRSKDQLERIKQQQTVGSVPKADVYRQEVEVGRYDLLYRQSLNDFDNAKADLLSLIGENPGLDIALDETSLQTTVSSNEIDEYRNGLDENGTLYQSALKQRNDYQSSKVGLESAGKSETIAFAGHLPSLSVFARYNWNNLEFKDVLHDGSTSYGLTISVPILSNLRTAAAVEYAEISRMEAEETHSQLERTIAVNIRKALNTLDYNAENVRIAQQTLRSAQEDRRIAEERYNLGAGILLDLTTANANLLSAESDVINARFNYLRARKYLEYQLGITE